MNAELVLDRMGAHVVACAVRHHFRHQKQRDSFGAWRRVGQPCKYEMDDVVCEIVLAVSNENLRSRDAIAAVTGALRLTAQRSNVGTRLWLGELHGAHPFAADELAEIFFFERLASIGMQGVDRRHGEQRADAES